MQVLKFGGSSVANAENILKVCTIVKDRASKDRTIVVVSALGGITDLLLRSASLAAAGNESYREVLLTIEIRHIDAVKELIPLNAQSQLLSLVKKTCNELDDICNGIFLLGELTNRSKDRLTSYGEWLSSKIIHEKLVQDGFACNWVDMRKLIITNEDYTGAQVNFPVTDKNIREYFIQPENSLFVCPGFIASTNTGIVTTLGRGGSDYTASIIASAVEANILEIWTDVSGMMTADPRLTANARIIPEISYQEAMELSHFGAKVIYPPTIQPVMNKGIPVRIKNTFAPSDEGTLIQQGSGNNGNIIRGISSITQFALLSLEGSGMVGIPGFSKRLFEALSSEKINVILITQGSSEHSICVGIEESHVERARAAVDEMFNDEITLQKVDPLKTEKNLSIIALVGENMKNHTGISGRMFSALGKNGVNVRAIAQGSSEKNISAVISTDDMRKAVNVLHEEFFETSYKQVNVFIAGAGNVGARLIAQFNNQKDFLLQHKRIQLRVAGISNSRKMIFADDIPLSQWEDFLNNGAPADINLIPSEIISRNLRNSVFVDVTASQNVPEVYAELLKKNISVVACNKVAASSSYENYRALKDVAGEYNSKFLFSTNVGAGLPVLATLSDLIHSGDRVHKIQAVLSGTLNFVFNNYTGKEKFADVVRQARAEGYTEPDPRLDLGGTDVMRKILILARESGVKMEMADIVNNTFMPASCMTGSVEDFYASMYKEEDHFRELLRVADASGCKLKFVASFEDGFASVGLQPIPPAHDLYHLYGKDNIVLFYTDRYKEQPLVVKGAGAGADVTASGVFADIIRAVN